MFALQLHHRILLAALVSAIALGPLSPAATLPVGPGETLTSIQAAIDAATPGDTITVAAGTYPENVVVSVSPLTLLGPQAENDARDRMTGSPDPATEAVVAPAAGPALMIASNAGPVTVKGFSFLASAPADSGTVAADSVAITACLFANNHVEATAGPGAALSLGAGSVDATLSANVFLAATTSPAAIVLGPATPHHGLHCLDNNVLRDGSPAHSGLQTDGDRNLGPSGSRSPLIRGNRFEGHGTGLDGGSRAIDAAEISGNTFTGNDRGMSAGPRNTTISANLWHDNAIAGLEFRGSADPLDGAQHSTVEDNTFRSNGSTIDPTGYGDFVLGSQAPGTHATNTIRHNRFASPVALFNGDPATTADAAFNHWNAADGPSGNAPGSGSAIIGSGATVFEPFYADSDLTTIVFGTTPLTDDLTLSAGESIQGDAFATAADATLTVLDDAWISVDTLTLGTDSEVNVHHGEIRCGQLQLDPGAVLDVIDGSVSLDPLDIGEFHTIAGTFTFYNCLGSIEIGGNTTFSGSTLGIASDIHVATGVTLHVLGSLVLDGCNLDSTGNYNLQVNTGATFELVRCSVTGAAFVTLVGSDVLLRDNRFVSSSITVFSTVNGGQIYHNVFNNGTGALNIFPGAVVTTGMEGWDNVDDPGSVQNELSLAFRAPSDPTRTLDAEGRLYVQPGDPVAVALAIGKLNAKAQAVEALLGFSTDHLTYDSLAPTAEWPNDIYQASDGSAVIGRFDTTVGYGFTQPDPDGTTTDADIADIHMSARTLEGRTRVIFRTNTPEDHPMIDTRITVSSAGTPSFKEFPFTRNSPDLTIDGTPPEFGPDPTAVQSRDGSSVNVLATGVLTRMGTVTVSFDVHDDLAGIDDDDVTAELSGPGGTLAGTLTGTSTVDVGGTPYTRYVFEFEITASTPDGLYDLDATAMDRSGNAATLAIGTIEIARFSVAATVEPEGLVSDPLTREVIFVATDATGATLATWAAPVDFVNGTGSVLLDAAPAETAFLSAKTAWNLRVRLPITFDAGGDATVSFSGTSQLPGGDFTGDNRINTLDYIILRDQFPSFLPEADITADGRVNTLDYIIFRDNWLTAGDPL